MSMLARLLHAGRTAANNPLIAAKRQDTISAAVIVGDFRTGYTYVGRIAMTMEIIQHFVWAD
ncbi:MAG TPA: hypothetical protein VHR39_19355 [Propionibacteriaceae bacterium]|jgi:hypothetical protein|nr:hypothetical protein [Propionibacteriaceae bacterium]